MKLLKKQGLDESTTVAGHISLSPVSLHISTSSSGAVSATSQQRSTKAAAPKHSGLMAR